MVHILKFINYNWKKIITQDLIYLEQFFHLALPHSVKLYLDNSQLNLCIHINIYIFTDTYTFYLYKFCGAYKGCPKICKWLEPINVSVRNKCHKWMKAGYAGCITWMWKCRGTCFFWNKVKIHTSFASNFNLKNFIFKTLI